MFILALGYKCSVVGNLEVVLSKMHKIILIGGAPTSGKTYLAKKLSQELNIPWISTDTIREQMRGIVRKEDYPALFKHAGATGDMAEEFLTQNTAKEIVDHQNTESEDVWKGVKALIEGDYVWGSMIIEGVAILPHLVSEIIKMEPVLKPIFLVDEDEERIHDTVFTRGLWDDADKYPDSVKEKEVEWVKEFNHYLIEECEKYNFPIVRIGDRTLYLDEVKKLVA